MQALKDHSPSKREVQKQARRNAIIDAGFQEFALQGFTATKLDDVAVRAGIGKGTIYLYFDSKETLFEEVIRKNMVPVLEEAARNAERFQGSAEQLLTMHFNAMYSALHMEKMPQLVAMIMGETARFPDMAEFFFNEVVSYNKQLVRSIVQKGIDSGEFRDSFPVDFTQILLAPAMMSALWKLQFDIHSPLDIDAYAKAHIEFVLRGLKAET